MDDLFKFIEETCKLYNIDESHGLSHSKRCIQFANTIMEDYPDINEDENKIIIYGVALHDMCDSKYTDVEKGSIRIGEWLLSQRFDIELKDTIIRIITTLSYTKLKNTKDKLGYIVYPDHGEWLRAYHIIRHADLLDAYLVDRCFEFQKHKYPTMNDKECWDIVKNIFDERIFKYVSDGWIFFPVALRMVPEFERVAREILQKTMCL